MLHSPLRFPLLSRALAAAFLMVGSAALHAQIQLSDFEATEGFIAGQTISGKAGWSTSSSADFQVIDTFAASGSQSLRVLAATNGRLDSPALLEHDLVGLSLQVRNNGVAYAASRTFSRFRIVLGQEAEGGVQTDRILQFQFQYHSTSAASYTLSYYDWVDGASVTKTRHFSTDLMPADAWAQFRFEANMETQTYSVWVGETQLVTGVSIGGGQLTGDSRISQLQFWGHTAAGSGYTLYDQVVGLQAIPEPGSVTLLGGALLLGAAGFLRTRSNR